MNICLKNILCAACGVILVLVGCFLLMAATLPSVPPSPRETENSGVRISGKKMEILPRESTNIFSGDVVVEHSSFTMTADRVVSRNSNRRIEASGSVKITSVVRGGRSPDKMLSPHTTLAHTATSTGEAPEPSRERIQSISGDEAIYFAPASTGTVSGKPAVMIFNDEKNITTRLETSTLNFSTYSALAAGSSTTLTRQDIDGGFFLRITADEMKYMRCCPESFFAQRPHEIYFDSKKKNIYRARFSADELFYDISGGKIRLKGNVDGRVVIKK